jgi:hypothetical protein
MAWKIISGKKSDFFLLFKVKKFVSIETYKRNYKIALIISNVLIRNTFVK